MFQSNRVEGDVSSFFFFYLLKDVVHLAVGLRETFRKLVKLVHKPADITTTSGKHLGERQAKRETSTRQVISIPDGLS